MKKDFIIRVTFSTLAFVIAYSACIKVKADDNIEHEVEKHFSKGIVTACDLKQYANSKPTSKAYAFFQGYVYANISSYKASLNGCSLNVSDIAIISDVKTYVNGLSDCKVMSAQSAIDVVLASELKLCF